MKRWTYMVLILCLALLLSACGGEKNTAPEADKPTVQQHTAATDALSTLRADMKPPVLAVADLGYFEVSQGLDVMDYLTDEYPEWIKRMTFIRDMPEERILLTCDDGEWGYLVCIVPQDPDASVAVTLTDYSMEVVEDQVLYRSESGEPILLLVDTSEDVVINVTVVGEDGRGIVWHPYWGYYDPIPESEYYGALVMDFTPQSEKPIYDLYLENGWYVPDTSFLAGGWWQSDYGYDLELTDYPTRMQDGEAYLSAIDENGYSILQYAGHWSYDNGFLILDMTHVEDKSLTIQGEFPVLSDPYGSGWLWIGRSADGTGLPRFSEDQYSDELWPVMGSMEDPYAYALSQGWRVPEFYELDETFWYSGMDYALELMDNSVPGDNGGWARIYDIGTYGEYTQSYSGSWTFSDGMLHLSLSPLSSDGYMVDDSFPVLMLDGELWIGRTEYGFGLPHFTSDTIWDVLWQPVG